MAKSSQFFHVSSVLNSVFNNIGLAKKLKQQHVLKIWPQVVGAEISSISWPLEFKYKTLRVVVSDPIWMQQLSLLEHTIINKINAQLMTSGNELMEKIYFQLGVLPKIKESLPSKKLSQPLELSTEENDIIEETVKNLSNPELKEALKSLFQKALIARKRQENK